MEWWQIGLVLGASTLAVWGTLSRAKTERIASHNKALEGAMLTALQRMSSDTLACLYYHHIGELEKLAGSGSLPDNATGYHAGIVADAIRLLWKRNQRGAKLVVMSNILDAAHKVLDDRRRGGTTKMVHYSVPEVVFDPNRADYDAVLKFNSWSWGEFSRYL